MNAALLLLALIVPGTLVTSVASAGVVTVCQANLYNGGRWTEQDQSQITYDTARRFAEWVATVNPTGSPYPPIAVVGVQELMSETDRTTLQGFLQQTTGMVWQSARTAQGVNGTSGIGMFWRPDLVEYLPQWYLGERTLEQLDNGYVIKFVGRLFRNRNTEEAFGLFTGKLVWDGAVLNGQTVTEEIRRAQAAALKDWILNGVPGSPGMSQYPGTARIIATDLNSGVGTATWQEMNADFSDPSTQKTHSSFLGVLLDIAGRRLDYVWWDRDSGVKQPGGFVDGPRRSPHFGSDHRAVYATVEVHPVDLTPPAVTLQQPVPGIEVTGPVMVSAQASDSSGILQVEFYADGVRIWTDTVPPYEFLWDPQAQFPGFRVLTAVATDASSNRMKGSSAPVVVWAGPSGSRPGVGGVKLLPDGTSVALEGQVVSAVFSDGFYVQDEDRSAGMRVTGLAGPPVGTRVRLTGTLRTLNLERILAISTMETLGAGAAPQPLLMRGRDVGGGGFGEFAQGVYAASGLSNFGLLVGTWGRVTYTSPPHFIYVDDGSGLWDGSGFTGVRVDISSVPGLAVPSTGSVVAVEGISMPVSISGKIQRRLKIRSSSDIRPLSG